MVRFKIAAVSFLAITIIINLYGFYVPKPLFDIKQQIFSLSAGNHYFGLLNLYYYLAENQHWDIASTVEKYLDPADISYFRSQHYPPILKKTLNELTAKSQKTSDDLVELARIQLLLGMKQDANDSLYKAKNLDPVREDISQAYFEVTAR